MTESSFCFTCRNTRLVQASPTRRDYVMDCPECATEEGETLEEQVTRLRERNRVLSENIANERRISGAVADLNASQAAG